MLANKNVYQFQHCRNALEIKNSLLISGSFDNIYVNKFSHFCQNGIFRSDNVTLVIPGGNSIIRREENLSANEVYTTHIISVNQACNKIFQVK